MANTKREQVRARPAARVATILIGLLLLCMGFVAGREQWWVHRDNNDAQPWVKPALEFIGRAEYQDWLMPAGFAVAFLGLIYVIIAIRNRKLTHVALQNTANEELKWFARPLDIARLCTAAAQEVPGVDKALTSVNSKAKKITVTVYPTVEGQGPSLEEDVRQAITPVVTRLAKQPKVKIVSRRTS